MLQSFPASAKLNVQTTCLHYSSHEPDTTYGVYIISMLSCFDKKECKVTRQSSGAASPDVV